MAKKNATEQLPGVPLAQFRAAVDAIAEVCDAGKALIFVHGTGMVRIVGLSRGAAEIHQQLSERLQGEALNPSQMREALKEIEETISAILGLGSEREAAERLLYYHLDSFDKESKFDLKNPAHEHIFNKVQAAAKLVTDATKRRLLRLRSATIPCLEELDAELVTDRQDRLTGTRVDAPFLRLRLRYTVRTATELPQFYRIWVPPKSFELECDLSDLDLLQQRLEEARQMLLDASTVKEVVDDKKQ